MRRGMEAGRIWGRGIEWDAVRALLARQARTAMGRERALTVEPLADLPAIQSAIEATRQGRLALAEAGTPPPDTFPAVRPIPDPCRITRSVLVGTELALLVPSLDAGRRLLPAARHAGQPLFVEPAEAVEANNALVRLAREEEAEPEGILAELTDAVRTRVADLDVLVDAVGDLDWIFARAHLAERMAATAPVVDSQRGVALRGARHPLLLAQSWDSPDRPVVPVDLELTVDRPAVVITRPNAGGKTIALKN